MTFLSGKLNQNIGNIEKKNTKNNIRPITDISQEIVMRKVPKAMFIDKLHRGAVSLCIGVTVIGTALFGVRIYRYFSVIKPMRQEQELKMIQEGSIDNAPTLKT